MKALEKKWLSEYKNVPRKRCMKADVVVGADGRMYYPDTLRNRIRIAGIAGYGKPVSIQDIAKHLRLTYAAVNLKIAGKRPWTREEKMDLAGFLGRDVFDNAYRLPGTDLADVAETAEGGKHDEA